MLAAFNQVPGFPLDGGRILRAAAWWKSGDAGRAMRIATSAGRIAALCLIGFGLLGLLAGAGLRGLWLAFIGWFLLEAAESSLLQWEARAVMGAFRVGELMGRPCATVGPEMTVQELVEDRLLRRGERCHLVEDGGAVIGLLTLKDVRAVDKERWPRTPVAQAMRPLAGLRTVREDEPASRALEILSREELNQLPVTRDGRVEGVVSRADLLRPIQVRAELDM